MPPLDVLTRIRDLYNEAARLGHRRHYAIVESHPLRCAHASPQGRVNDGRFMDAAAVARELPVPGVTTSVVRLQRKNAIFPLLFSLMIPALLRASVGKV
jgi:hypothetical protein